MKNDNNKIPLATEIIIKLKKNLNVYKIFTIASGIIITVLLIILFIGGKNG